MGFTVYFVAFFVIYALLCSVGFIIFNEEILLTFCFLSFVFFAFHSFSDTVFLSMQQRATKFESDFSENFSEKKTLVKNTQKFYLQSYGLHTKLKILLLGLSVF